jgi:hypothetical protein
VSVMGCVSAKSCEEVSALTGTGQSIPEPVMDQ